MRLLALATLCLIAPPASAQRVDTRIIDVRQTADGRQTCRFNAVSDLQMTEPRGGAWDAVAKWARKSRDGDAWLHARFTPAEPDGHVEMIEIATSSFNGNAASAQLFLDDAASPVAFDFRSAGWDRRMLVPRDSAAMAEAMRYTDFVQVDLFDKAGARLASYPFWIGDLQNIAEYPRLVQWRCS